MLQDMLHQDAARLYIFECVRVNVQASRKVFDMSREVHHTVLRDISKLDWQQVVVTLIRGQGCECDNLLCHSKVRVALAREPCEIDKSYQGCYSDFGGGTILWAPFSTGPLNGWAKAA